MNDYTTSRRTFLLGSMGLAASAFASSHALTAGQVIDRIKAQVGIPWRAQTVDNLIAGTAETPVKGIATTMMATLEVVQRAAAAGKNMVITHESTFFSHQDRLDQIQQDLRINSSWISSTKTTWSCFTFTITGTGANQWTASRRG